MIAIALPAKSATYHREPTACAAEMLRGFTRADRRVIVCKGQVDMADLVLAALEITGPARVTVSAWEVDEDDVIALGAAVADARAITLDIVSTASNRPAGKALLARAQAAFGAERVHLTATHAKVATLENDRWSLVIRGSMNMRRQHVIEQVEVENSPEICAAWHAYLGAQQPRAVFPKANAPDLGRAALAVMPPGGRTFGLTRGYSAIDLLRAALERTGPAEVDIAGYKLSPETAEELARLLAAGRIARLRVLVSPAFIAQSPREGQAVEDALTPDRARLAWFHGRFFVVRGGRRAITVHSSANLNANPRCEQWDASEEPASAAFFAAIHAEAWNRTPPGVHTPRAALRDVLRSLLTDPASERGPAVAFSAHGSTSFRAGAYHADPPIARRYDTDPPLALP